MDLAAIRTLESETGKTRPNEPWALFPHAQRPALLETLRGFKSP